jgi:hypothetical protein
MNIDKKNTITFITNNLRQYPLNIKYSNKYIEESVNKKFFGLQIGNDFN